MVMTNDSSLFVDTNILIYATDPHSPFQPLAAAALGRMRDQAILLVVSPQVLREYLAVASRPATVGGGVALNDILDNIDTFRNILYIVDDGAAVLNQLLLLIRQTPIASRRVHDANIVATMRAHGLRRLLTHNTRDFAPYADLIEIVPLVPSPTP